MPGAHHPIVRTHPVSGKKALYLGRRFAYPSQYVDGMPDEESERLLDVLWDHATNPAFVWRHVWRRGDLLLWDNRCTLHRRDSIPPTAPRVMHRTLIGGDAPLEGLRGVPPAGARQGEPPGPPESGRALAGS